MDIRFIRKEPDLGINMAKIVSDLLDIRLREGNSRRLLAGRVHYPTYRGTAFNTKFSKASLDITTHAKSDPSRSRDLNDCKELIHCEWLYSLGNFSRCHG